MPKSTPNIVQMNPQGVKLAYNTKLLVNNNWQNNPPFTQQSVFSDVWGGNYLGIYGASGFGVATTRALLQYGWNGNGITGDTPNLQQTFTGAPITAGEHRQQGYVADAFTQVLPAQNVLSAGMTGVVGDVNDPFAFCMIPNIHGNHRAIQSVDVPAGAGNTVSIPFNIGTPGRYILIISPWVATTTPGLQQVTGSIDGVVAFTFGQFVNRANDYQKYVMAAQAVTLGAGDHTFTLVGQSASQVFVGPVTVMLLWDPLTEIVVDYSIVRNSAAARFGGGGVVVGKKYLMLAECSGFTAIGNDVRTTSIAYDNGASTNHEVANQVCAINPVGVHQCVASMMGYTVPDGIGGWYCAGASASPGSAYPWNADSGDRSCFVFIPDLYVG